MVINVKFLHSKYTVQAEVLKQKVSNLAKAEFKLRDIATDISILYGNINLIHVVASFAEILDNAHLVFADIFDSTWVAYFHLVSCCLYFFLKTYYIIKSNTYMSAKVTIIIF